MLEAIVSYHEIHDRPYIMLPWAFGITLVSIFIASQVPLGKGLFGLTSIVFVIIPSVFFITHLIRKEEKFDEQLAKKHLRASFLGRHGTYLAIMFFYFAGMTLAYAAAATYLPSDFFFVQNQKINQIQGAAPAGALTGEFLSTPAFWRILANNLQVMIFSLLFSFLFGAGAVFILAWNASILGVYMGQLAKSLWQIPVVGLGFLPHGIPEIGSYILAGLAGGLLSVAILKKANSEVMKTVGIDAAKIIALAVALVVVGAITEVTL